MARSAGQVRVRCHVDGERFIVEVADEGAGIGPRRDSSRDWARVGHGGRVGADARYRPRSRRARHCRDDGLRSRAGHVAAPPRLETLCALALETVADVSCVDLVHEGVLRRVAAEVADDPALTTWLRTAVPPAKPGTATWSALREGGARLVVHDPTVPRSPGGTGERLNLAWWIAVPLENPDGTPAALWGLGGRRGWTSGTARGGHPHLRRRCAAATSRSPPSALCCAVGCCWRAATGFPRITPICPAAAGSEVAPIPARSRSRAAPGTQLTTATYCAGPPERSP